MPPASLHHEMNAFMASDIWWFRPGDVLVPGVVAVADGDVGVGDALVGGARGVTGAADVGQRPEGAARCGLVAVAGVEPSPELELRPLPHAVMIVAIAAATATA